MGHFLYRKTAKGEVTTNEARSTHETRTQVRALRMLSLRNSNCRVWRQPAASGEIPGTGAHFLYPVTSLELSSPHAEKKCKQKSIVIVKLNAFEVLIPRANDTRSLIAVTHPNVLLVVSILCHDN